MYYLTEDGERKLIEVGRILAEKREVCKYFYKDRLLLVINQNNTTQEKIKSIFVIANSERRGFNQINLQEAVREFENGFVNKTEEVREVQPFEQHNKFLGWLVNLPYTGQKTANLFLKWVVMFSNDNEFNLNLNGVNWQDWAAFLHVPIDRWVLRLLKDKLRVGNEEFRNTFPQIESPYYGGNRSKYGKLQKDLLEIAQLAEIERIIYDELWFVGFSFCAYSPFFCGQCWLRDYCCNNVGV